MKILAITGAILFLLGIAKAGLATQWPVATSTPLFGSLGDIGSLFGKFTNCPPGTLTIYGAECPRRFLPITTPLSS